MGSGKRLKARAGGRRLTVLFVSSAPATAEEQAGWEWLTASGAGRARRVAPAELGRELPAAGLVWWHAARGAPRLAELAAGEIQRVRTWVQAGGRLWLTLHAASLLPALGLEDRLPDELGWPAWRHAETELEALEGERRGVVGFGPHPVFDGLAGGAPLFQPREGEAYPEAVYTRSVRGRVVAAEWQYLTIEPNRRIVLEHELGRGRVLTVGAHLLFGAAANPFRASLERFASNCLRSLVEPHGRRSYWPAVEFRPASRELGNVAPCGAGPAEPAQLMVIDGQPSLVSRGAGDWQVDVTGRRIVLIGRERSGVREVWSLPVRLAREVTAAFDGVPESEALVEFRRLPAAVQRIFDIGGRRIVQTISAGADEARLSYEVDARLGRLELGFECDLRYCWPYPEGVLGQPALQHAGGELLLLDGEGAQRGAIRFEPAPADLAVATEPGRMHVRARFDSPSRVRAAFRAPPEMRRSKDEDAANGGLLQIETPDEDFNTDLFWAINGLRAFDLEAPAGRGLVAGLAETGTGWWGGRLGYAWFFGRDTVWSSEACLGVGMHEAVRESLRLQARYQSPDGKIFHELTPAGIGHFDAADSTPLFLMGLERYVRWTADMALLGDLWPATQRALAFCFSTDRDGDGLIENTGVGHGWSEGGPVYGAHATFYLNACWAAALQSTLALAEWQEDGVLARRCRAEFARVRRLLNERFYQPQEGWFAYGLARDASLMPAKTIEPSVGALFGLLERDRLERFFDAIVTPGWSAPWGVRYIAEQDPAYHPRGYHHGSVWPLFTGWAAAAEYAHGRAGEAFEHVRASLRQVRRRSLGVIDEVLDGDSGEAAGVCPHQLWSHGMTVMPVLRGMLGIHPDAVANTLALRPQLPPAWDFVRVKDLRVGAHSLSFSYERGPSGWALATASAAAGLQLDFRQPAHASVTDHARR
jgi:glycogen debranching enzyme